MTVFTGDVDSVCMHMCMIVHVCVLIFERVCDRLNVRMHVCTFRLYVWCTRIYIVCA